MTPSYYHTKSAMPLQPFSFPVPETRFLKAGSFIYKFKIRGGIICSGEEVLKGKCFNQEMEDIIRTVLGNLDHLEPFSTTHYVVFPYKKCWRKVHKHRVKRPRLYPFVIILYVEKNTHKGKHPEEEGMPPISRVSDEPRPKRRCRDSPLEEAVLKELTDCMEGENNRHVTSKVDLDYECTEEEVNEDPTLVDEPEVIRKEPEGERTPTRPGILTRLARLV
ncbi:uncharacterized protein LOC119409388 [Nematolebias whitei]|uniref:uncharacterized protein LOC119409388 n=1 Tax=Nematolebias whitei TaxID=451745 RepID=UPI001899658E|nr:uncharacterized protein LOC119409388 [Nematolebias whitei]